MKKLFIAILSLMAITSHAIPPDYSFRNPVLISGTNLLVGSKYRFSNVRAGTDAIVTIVQFTAGVSLTSVDDGSAGYADAFQPYVVSPANSNGYAEFKIEFVNAGTIIPRIMTTVAVTPIDVDGDVFAPANLYEFDMVSLNPLGYYIDYDMVGSDLTINVAGNWVTGRNTAAINYPGIDSSIRRVMFTVVNSNISSFDLRLGAQNGSGASNNRRKSIYFASFAYPNSFLSKNSLISFTGIQRNRTIDLNWQVEAKSIINTILERGVTPTIFEPLVNMWTGDEENKNNITFNYRDNVMNEKDHYYRLKIVNTDGTFQYSNVLVFRSQNSPSQEFKVFPNHIGSSTTINVKTQKSGPGIFQLIDYSGRVIMQQNLLLDDGINNISVNNLGSVEKGYYVAYLKINGTSYSQKVYKR